MIAAVFIEAVDRLGEKHAVEHGQTAHVAGAHAENGEILVLAAGVDDLDLLAGDLEIHQVLRLREEEILRAADGVELVGEGLLRRPAVEFRAALCVDRQIQRHGRGDRGKQRVELFDCNFRRLGRLEIVLGIVDNRRTAADLRAGLIVAVEAVDVVDEFTVEQMKRDMLRADAGAFAAIRAASGHMEGADDVEQLFLKGVGRRLVLHAGIRVVEHALFAGAGRADVAAGVAADAARKLVLPEGIALVGRHALEPLDLVKAVRVEHVAVLAEQLVIGNVLPGLAVDAAVGQQLRARQRERAVIERFDRDRVAFDGERGQLPGAVAQLAAVEHPVAGHADCVDLLAVKAVLRQELIEAIGVAGLQEDQNLPLAERLLHEIFGKIRAAEIVPDERLLQLLRAAEHGGRHVVAEFTGLPAEHAVDRSVGKQSRRPFHELVHFLHRRSSNLLFSPSAATVLTKSFIVAANFAPSAALTHSTRVRSRSMPRKSSIENSSAMRRRA